MGLGGAHWQVWVFCVDSEHLTSMMGHEWLSFRSHFEYLSESVRVLY